MKNIEPKKILNIICNHYDVSQDLIVSSNRQNHMVIARQMYCYFAKKYSDKSYRFIGELINRDHCTVIFSIKKIEEQRLIYPNLQNQYRKIKKKLLTPKCVINHIDLLEIAKKILKFKT